jgi:multidrug resistance protein, MATE family
MLPTLPTDTLPLKTEIRESLRLTIPLASAQVAQAATGFVDTVMMGWLGQSTLAAGGLAATTFTTLLVISNGLLMGISPLLAEAYGAGQRSRIQRLTHQGLWLGLLIAIPLTLLLGHSELLLRRLGQPESLVAAAKSYLDILCWGLFPALMFALLKTVVAALAQPRVIMVIVLAGTVLNAIGNYLIGLGNGGFPQLGLVGIAWSSTISQWLMLFSLMGYMLMHPQFQVYRWLQRWHPVRLSLQRELWMLGVPIAISFGLEIGLFTITTYLMGALGTDMLAAHQIVFQTIAIVFMVPLGMSFATTIRVGQWNGQSKPQHIRQTSYVSMGLGGLYMLIVAIGLILFPRSVIGIYLDVNQPENAPVIALATSMLIIAAISQILDGVQTNASGALRGLKDAQIPMVLSFVSFWGVGLTSGYVLGFVLGLKGIGLWLGQLLGVATAAALFVGRFQQLMRSRDAVL